MQDFVQEAVEATIAGHPGVVGEWLTGAPKTWGYLAGRAVGIARRRLGRSLTDAERRQVWAALWERLGALAGPARSRSLPAGDMRYGEDRRERQI